MVDVSLRNIAETTWIAEDKAFGVGARGHFVSAKSPLIRASPFGTKKFRLIASAITLRTPLIHPTVIKTRREAPNRESSCNKKEHNVELVLLESGHAT